jgi:hypothetical protein
MGWLLLPKGMLKTLTVRFDTGFHPRKRACDAAEMYAIVAFWKQFAYGEIT